VITIYLTGLSIKERLVFNQQESDVTVAVTGHADYNQKGKDIVCASVSTLIQTAERALIRVAGVKHTIKKSQETFSFTFAQKQLSSLQYEATLIILHTMLIGLEEIANQYPLYIEIEFK
jgi:uncharacterized protein